MNTITPLMRAMLEALDKADVSMTQPALSLTLAYMGHREGADLEELALSSLVAEGLVANISAVFKPRFAITDAGCDALWALQKADAVSAAFVAVDTAHGPEQGIRVTFANGSVIECTDTNYAPLTGTARPVRFNSRDELRAYFNGGVPA